MDYRGDHQNFNQGNVHNLHPLGQRFQRLCRSKRLQNAMPDYGFMDGGCLSLALAVQRILGPACEVVFVVAAGVPQHAVVQLTLDGEAFYLDADGLASEADLLAKMRLVELVRAPGCLASVSLDEAAKHNVTDGENYSEVLAPLLASLLQTFPVEILVTT